MSRYERQRIRAREHQWWRALRLTHTIEGYDGVVGFQRFLEESQADKYGASYGCAPIMWKWDSKDAHDIRWVNSDHHKWTTPEAFLRSKGVNPGILKP